MNSLQLNQYSHLKINQLTQKLMFTHHRTKQRKGEKTFCYLDSSLVAKITAIRTNIKNNTYMSILTKNFIYQDSTFIFVMDSALSFFMCTWKSHCFMTMKPVKVY